VTDEVRDYASDHGSRPAGDGVHRLRSKTQSLGDVAGMQIGETHLVRTSRWRRARLSARAKPLDVTPERWSPRCCGRTPSAFRFDGSPLKEAEEVQRKTTLDRGRTLRTALGIKGSPLLESRKVRNALEHFDDRSDRYFEAGHRMVVDRNIGPKNRLVVIGDKPALHLRLIDTEAGTVSVLEDEVPIQGLFDAIVDVSNRVHGWLTEHGQ